MNNIFIIALLALVAQSNAVLLNNADFVGDIELGPNRVVVGMYPVATENYPDAIQIWQVQEGDNYVSAHDILWQAIVNLDYFGGGIVEILEGTYNVDRNLILDFVTKIHIRGAGTDKTVLRLTDYAPSFISSTGTTKAGFIRTRNTENIIISDLTLDGNKDNQYANTYEDLYGKFGVYIEGCNKVWLNNVASVNWLGYGFHIHGDKKGDNYHIEGGRVNIKGGNMTALTNCVAQNNNLDGFMFDRMSSSVAIDNLAFSNGRHGFQVMSGSYDLFFSRNVALNNGYNNPTSGCGYNIKDHPEFRTHGLLFAGNTARFNKKSAFCLTGEVTDVTLQESVISNQCFCYYLTNNVNSYIENNDCTAKFYYRNNNSPVTTDPAQFVGQTTFIGSADRFHNQTYCTQSLITYLTSETVQLDYSDDVAENDGGDELPSSGNIIGGKPLLITGAILMVAGLY